MNGSSSGISVTGVLTIVFVILKVLGVIAWSWWWVLSPLWIGFGIAALVFLLIMAVSAVVGIVAAKSADR